jgi:dimethylhistidine N-methyltransferase
MTIRQERMPRADRRTEPAEEFLADVLRGLSGPVRTLPCKYFYDAAGSALFERITELDEYYLTRTELAIMRQHVAEMAGLVGEGCLLVEYGSGSSTKTRLLLDHLREPVGYVPIDLSEEPLRLAAGKIAADYPRVEVLPLCADFTQTLELSVPRRPPARRVVYFPGSTIGNFTPEETVLLLRQTATLCGSGGAMLLGADLQKDRHVLDAAYNDRHGITAAFNLNLLVRINRELGADFRTDEFTHSAFYNAAEGRIEMHLVSRREQQVHVGGATFAFTAGDTIRTEYSYKYRLRDLQELAEAAGFEVERFWTDDREYFSVHYLTV